MKNRLGLETRAGRKKKMKNRLNKPAAPPMKNVRVTPSLSDVLIRGHDLRRIPVTPPRTPTRVLSPPLSPSTSFPEKQEEQIVLTSAQRETVKRLRALLYAKTTKRRHRHVPANAKFTKSFQNYSISRFRHPFEVHQQRMLEIEVIPHRNPRHYGPEDEHRTCIWPAGGQLSWTEKSSGKPWIGVNGTATTCVVAMNGRTSNRPSGKRSLCTRDVLRTSLADMGVWADTAADSAKFRRDMVDMGYKGGPFAVVSVAPDATVENHFLNISQKCEEDAINFLKQSLGGCSSLTFEETKQIAVCALKRLLGTEFNSGRIEVCATGDWEGSPEIMRAGEVDEILAMKLKSHPCYK